MKNSYPIILTPEEIGYTVYIPDFDINTEGDSFVKAEDMARDAIELMRIDLEDDGKEIPAPSSISEIEAKAPNGIVKLVEVDFSSLK